MRQLFLPACLCLMTMPGTTGADLKPTLDEFTGMRAPRTETAARPQVKAAAKAPVKPLVPPPELPTASTATSTILTAALDIPPAADTPPAIAAIEPERPSATLFPDIGADVSEPALLDVAMAEAVVLPQTAPLPRLRPPPRPVVHRSEEEICETLVAAAQSNDLPAPYFIRLLFQESRFRPGAISPVGALGIAQFMPETASGMGVQNPFDPLQAIPASARLLRELVGQFGNLGLAAAAYNAGPKRIQDWLASKGKGKLPEETQGYVRIITGREADTWKSPEKGSPPVKLPRHAPCQNEAGLLAWNGPDRIPIPQSAPHRLAMIAEATRLRDTLPAKMAETGAPSKGAVQLAARGRKSADAKKKKSADAAKDAQADAAEKKAAPEKKDARKDSGKKVREAAAEKPAARQDQKPADKQTGKPLRLTQR